MQLSIAAQDFEANKGRLSIALADWRKEFQALRQQPKNHSSHVFQPTWDHDTVRCVNCDVLSGGLKSGTECPASITDNLDRWFRADDEYGDDDASFRSVSDPFDSGSGCW